MVFGEGYKGTLDLLSMTKESYNEMRELQKKKIYTCVNCDFEIEGELSDIIDKDINCRNCNYYNAIVCKNGLGHPVYLMILPKLSMT
ncbi:MAG: hypothetical protein HeimC3_55230 [Candidatus Heimdallarchaeota archaeon LC_3]|nr:MAG: hypothetical protein HeimC3_55230 [Candidatus Heimdallarchaeota archaeon LC_3]